MRVYLKNISIIQHFSITLRKGNHKVALAAATAPTGDVAGQPAGPIPGTVAQQPGQHQVAAPLAAGTSPTSVVGDRYKDHPLVNNQFAGRYGNEAQPAPPMVPPTGNSPLLDRPAQNYRSDQPDQPTVPQNGGNPAAAPQPVPPQAGPAGQPAPQHPGLGIGPGEQQRPQPGMPQPGMNLPGVQPPSAANKQQAAPQGEPAASNNPAGLQLPPGVPPLAFDGYCVVSVRDDEIWRMGNPAWGVIHRGQTYLFHSQQAQEAFRSRPDYYGLVINGHDVVHYAETGQLVPGSREFGATHKSGGVFLFANEANLQQFQNDPTTFISRLQGQQAAAPRQR